MEFDVRYAVLEACAGVRIFGRGVRKRGVRTNNNFRVIPISNASCSVTVTCWHVANCCPNSCRLPTGHSVQICRQTVYFRNIESKTKQLQLETKLKYESILRKQI